MASSGHAGLVSFHAALRSNTPNPFNPASTIHFDAPREGGHVALDIYDTRGRLIRHLIDAELGPGRHDAVWDGHDGAGRAAASGVYVCQLRAC